MIFYRTLWIFALISLLSMISACGNSDPILIGFSGQLTGKVSDIGVFGRNGCLLAIEVINASGGIDGRPLKLISKDDLNTPEGAIKADKELVDAGVVAIVGHMTSSQTLAVMPLINESSTVLISPTTSTPQLSGMMDSFFRVMVENTVHGMELADYTRSALDINSVVTIANIDNKSYSLTFTKSFSDKFISIGGNILESLTYSSRDDSGWDPMVDAIINLNPDAVLLACPAEDAIPLVQRIRSAGLSTRIISGAWAYTDRLLEWGGQSVEGMIFVINYAADNPNPAFVKFRERYKNRFGAPPNFAATFGYEAVQALAEGLRKTDGNAKGLHEAMAPSDLIKGTIGDFKLDKFGDVKRNVFIGTVQEGVFRTIEMR